MTEQFDFSLRSLQSATALPPIPAPDVANVQPGGSVVIPVLANDRDPQNSPINVRTLGQPTLGRVQGNPDGSLIYTPNPGVTTGVDRFSYGLNNASALVTDGTVTVNIGSGVIPLPTPTPTPFPTPTPAPFPPPTPNFFSSVLATLPPIANPDAATTNPNTPVIIPVLANDRDPQNSPINVRTIGQPTYGQVQGNPDGTLTYIPNPGVANVFDRFSYGLNNNATLMTSGSVAINIFPFVGNPPPVMPVMPVTPVMPVMPVTPVMPVMPVTPDMPIARSLMDSSTPDSLLSPNPEQIKAEQAADALISGGINSFGSGLAQLNPVKTEPILSGFSGTITPAPSVDPLTFASLASEPFSESIFATKPKFGLIM